MAAYSHRQALILHFTWPASLAAISFCFFFLSFYFHLSFLRFFFALVRQLLNYYYAAWNTPTAKFLLEYVRSSYLSS